MYTFSLSFTLELINAYVVFPLPNLSTALPLRISGISDISSERATRFSEEMPEMPEMPEIRRGISAAARDLLLLSRQRLAAPLSPETRCSSLAAAEIRREERKGRDAPKGCQRYPKGISGKEKPHFWNLST